MPAFSHQGDTWDFYFYFQCDGWSNSGPEDVSKRLCPAQGGLSVDSISDLVESQSRLLEALQLSHPAELELKKACSSEGRTQTKLSLNPIYRQVPRVLERCCSHIETHGEPSVSMTTTYLAGCERDIYAPFCVFRFTDGGNFSSGQLQEESETGEVSTSWLINNPSFNETSESHDCAAGRMYCFARS